MAFELSTAEIDSGNTASKRLVPPSRPNHNPSAPYRLAPIKLAPRNSVPNKLAFWRFERTRLAPRNLAIDKSAPSRFIRIKWAPCKLTPVRSAFAKFTPQRSALTPVSPPDSTQILCCSRISARSSSEIPIESPSLECSPPAGFPLSISLFNSSISLTACISRPIRDLSPTFFTRSGPSCRTSAPQPPHARIYQCVQIPGGTFRIPPQQAVSLPGSFHPLLPALWKSPARKYRRRTGNGGGLNGG